MIKFYLICIFLCAPFFIDAQVTRKADSLFSADAYLPARVEYERLLFQHTTGITNLLILRKSYCFKAEGKYEDDYTTLQLANFFEEADSLKTKLYYESALNAYLAGKYDLAFNKVQESQYYLQGTEQPFIDLIEILILNQQHKLADAEKKYKSFCEKFGIAGKPDIYQNKKLKDPEKAESISHFLPGIGQWYAGYMGRGITSGAIQAGLLLFTAYSFLNGYYFSGAFTGMGLFYMFNNGGARHAQYLAEKKNIELVNQINQTIMISAQEIVKK